MYQTSELKKGVIVELDGAPHVVESTTVSSPTARGGNTITRVKLRSLLTGQRIDKSFRGGETFQPADVERRPVQYLYTDPQGVHFMDVESYEQFMLAADDIAWERNFLVDGIDGVRAMFHNGKPIALELPNNVDLHLTETAPAFRGNSATARSKPATLETGFIVQVPEHIEQGIRVTIDTRTGEFLSRAKD